VEPSAILVFEGEMIEAGGLRLPRRMAVRSQDVKEAARLARLIEGTVGKGFWGALGVAPHQTAR
jgi:hypothetical protein